MTCRSKLLFCTGLGLLVFLAMTSPAKADLTGTTVTGSLQFDGNPKNYYDPANGFVPAGFQNSAGAQDSSTITILGGGNDFGFNDGDNQDVTSFSGTGFTFTDTCLLAPGACTAANNSITLSFTDSAFAGVTLLSSSFGGLTVGIAGDVITVDIPPAPPGFPGNGPYTASFDVTTTVPEPASLTLLGSGLIGLAGVIRRRKRALSV